jgi:hypothetical protein
MTSGQGSAPFPGDCVYSGNAVWHVESDQKAIYVDESVRGVQEADA